MKSNLKKAIITTVSLLLLFSITISPNSYINVVGNVCKAVGIVQSFQPASNQAYADVGNHSSYRSHSSSSSFHSSTRSSFGGSSSHSGSYSSGSGSGSMSLSGYEIGIIIVIIVGVIVLKKLGIINLVNLANTASGGEYSPSTNVIVPNNTNAIQTHIRTADALFSSEKFLSWTEEVYMTLQDAWMERDWAKIRPFEKEELFKLHERQLAEYKRLNRVNMMERICVNQSYLYKFISDAEYEYLVVYLNVTLTDYIIDADTKQIVDGNREDRLNNKYLMTFMRKRGVLTSATNSCVSTKQCPHCGAPVNITSAGMCEYCNTVVTTGEHDWVLSNLDSITGDTYIDNEAIQIGQ